MIDTGFDLLAKEAAVLCLLAALGSFPAAAVPGQLPATARVALAPAFGLALGLGVTLSAAQFLSMQTAAWAVLVPAVICSLAATVIMRRRRSAPSRPGRWRGALALAATALIVLLLCDAPFADQHTVGPAGYRIADAAGYVTLDQALAHHDWNSTEFGPLIDTKPTLGSRGMHGFLHAPVFQAGTGPLSASVAQLFGWDPLDIQVAFMAALVAAGAAGCFAFVFALAGSPWAAAAAGLLFAGPVAYQLFIDASQAALAGLSMLAPMALVAARVRDAPLVGGVLLGLAAGGIATTYPAWAAVLALSLLIGAGVALWREAGPRRERLRALGAAALALTLTAAAVAPVAIARDARYAHDVSRGVLDRNFGEANTGAPLRTLSFGRPSHPPTGAEQLPKWKLPAGSAPAWLTGARDLYSLPGPSAAGPARWILLDVAFPLLVLGLAVLGAVAFPASRVLLYVAASALLAALYAYGSRGCSYCGERDLLPLAVVLALLTSLGLAALALRLRALWGGGWGLAATVGLAAVVVLLPLQRDTVLARRLTGGGYLLGHDARAVLDRTARLRAGVAVEGLGSGPGPTIGIQGPLLISALIDRLQSPPVIDVHELPSASYFPGDRPGRHDIDPRYRWVFTALAGIHGPRRIVVRRGSYALQRRESTLDATVDSGVVSGLAQHDRSGRAWVVGPVTFTIVDLNRAPARLLVTLRGPAAAATAIRPPARVISRGPMALDVCLPVPGRLPVRNATLRLELPRSLPGGAPYPYTDFTAPPPAVSIASVRPRAGGCRPKLR